MEKIFYIGGEFPDKDASALRIIANAKALREYGYDVILIGQSKDIEGNILRIENFEGFITYLLPYPSTNSEWAKDVFCVAQYTNIIKMHSNVVAIICYNFHSIALNKLIKFGKKNRIVLIADCTEWHTVSHLDGIKKVIKKMDIDFSIRVIQFKTNGNIVISKYFEKFYHGRKNLVIPPLVDKKEVKWEKEYRKIKRITRFVYAGRIGIEKDRISDCIYAFHKLRTIEYIVDILGISKKDYLEKYPNQYNMIKDLEGRIHFHGMVSHKVALEFVKRANFSLLIREHNRKNDSGFPTKFVESITCGTPVIATEFSDIKDYINQYGFGLLIDNLSNLELTFRQAIEMPESKWNVMQKNCENNIVFDYRVYKNILGNFITTLVRSKIDD